MKYWTNSINSSIIIVYDKEKNYFLLRYSNYHFSVFTYCS